MQLEFTADWAGIATSLVSAGVAYNTQRNNLKLEMAKLQAQQALNAQAMKPPPAYPPAVYQPAPGQPALSVTPGIPQYQQPVYTTRAAPLPTWILPAGVGLLTLGAVFALRR